MPDLRLATIDDLDAIVALEETAFEPARRNSRRSFAHALVSTFQDVWVLEDEGLIASMVLWRFPRVVRIYSLAVHPSRQGQGIGRRLIDHAAAAAGLPLLLECTPELVPYYGNLGFVEVEVKPDFYGPDLHARRMRR